MKIYHVSLEPSTVYGKDVKIEAESMDEAIKIAKEKHCGKEQVEVSYRPDWVQPRPEDADEHYEDIMEYHFRVYGECDDCGVTLFEAHDKNPDNDWPWQHEAGDTRHHTYICYPCAMKRKEVGNYCPFFKHFYRSYKEGCDKCPPECLRAKTAHYEKLKSVLEQALRFSEAPRAAIQHLLDDNEFQIAWDALNECGARDDQDTLFDKHLADAKAMMEKGWE